MTVINPIMDNINPITGMIKSVNFKLFKKFHHIHSPLYNLQIKKPQQDFTLNCGYRYSSHPL